MAAPFDQMERHTFFPRFSLTQFISLESPNGESQLVKGLIGLCTLQGNRNTGEKTQMQPSEAEMVQFNYFIAKIKVQQAYKMVREAKVKKEKSGVMEAKISK